MNKSSKGFTPVLVFIILAIIGIGAILYFSNQPNKPASLAPIETASPDVNQATNELPDINTENWQTYINSKYGYSLKYPVNAELKDMLGNDNLKESLLLRISTNDDIFAIVTQHLKNKDESLNQFVERSLIKLGGIECETEQSTVDSREALLINCIGRVDQTVYEQYFVYILKDEYNAISIRPQDLKPGEEHIKNYFDQILSTFKFLDNNNNISWDEAKKLIQNCEVKSASQTHSLQVQLGLKNGSTINTTEPKIDDLFDEVNKSSEKCGDVIIATE